MIAILPLFSTGHRADVAHVQGALAVPAQPYLSVRHIISFNIFNNFMRGPPYLLKNKVHTHIHESVCMISLCYCLSLIAWDGYAYAIVCFWLSESDLCCRSETASPCLSLCVPG